MGHLHKHQTLYNQPLVYYCGSLQRVDFSEEKQEKGFVILDVSPDSSVNYKFIEVESQKFFTLNNNLIGQQNETDLIIDELNKNIDKVKNAIVRIRLDMDKSNFINDVRIYDEAYQLGAEYVLKIEKKYEKKDGVRNNELTEHVDEHKALKMYFGGKPNEDRIVKLGEEIIQKAKKEGRIP
ncbi:exonuclease subunit SbcD [compost metagenome]